MLALSGVESMIWTVLAVVGVVVLGLFSEWHERRCARRIDEEMRRIKGD